MNRRRAIQQLAALAAVSVTTGSDAQTPTPPPKPFAYEGTDPDAGARAFPMSRANLQPALVVWLFLTTNPKFISAMNADHKAQMATMGCTTADIAEALGLTENSVKYIAAVQAKSKRRKSYTDVAQDFQTIKGTFYGKICPPTGQDILTLAHCAMVSDPSKPDS